MARWKNLLRCIGQALCAKGLRALAGAVPFGESIYEIAEDAIERYRKQGDGDLRTGLQEVAQVDGGEIKAEAEAVARQVAGSQGQELQLQLVAYLTEVPATIRQSLRSPSDPTGTVVPSSVSLSTPADLVTFLPSRLPRFRPGDRPPGVGDWELVEL